MSGQKHKGLSMKTVGLAAIVAVVAGLGAVYVTGMPSGNTQAAGGGSCSAALAVAEAIQPLATGDVAAMASAGEAVALHELAFNGPDGAPMTVGDLSGKTLLINLWATWCPPCREEMPALNELQATLGGDAFEVVAINLDTGDDTKPKRFLDEIGVSDLGFYRDSSMGVFNELKAEGLAFGLPVTLLVDNQGCLLASMNGPAHWSGDDAIAYVSGALGAES